MENTLPGAETEERRENAERRQQPERRLPGVQVEQELSPERLREREHALDLRQERANESPVQAPAPASPQADAVVTQKSEELKAVESILSEHLDSVFRGMTPDQQQLFKQEGEITAQKVTTLLSQVHLKVKAITDLILRWLKRIPGVSRFFLEQETKIKTDQLLELRRRNRPDLDS